MFLIKLTSSEFVFLFYSLSASYFFLLLSYGIVNDRLYPSESDALFYSRQQMPFHLCLPPPQVDHRRQSADSATKDSLLFREFLTQSYDNDDYFSSASHNVHILIDRFYWIILNLGIPTLLLIFFSKSQFGKLSKSKALGDRLKAVIPSSQVQPIHQTTHCALPDLDVLIWRV